MQGAMRDASVLRRMAVRAASRNEQSPQTPLTVLPALSVVRFDVGWANGPIPNERESCCVPPSGSHYLGGRLKLTAPATDASLCGPMGDQVEASST